MQKKGVLLVNLGTPDSPSVADVRKYLKEFLLDERVIDIPFIPRNLLVRGIIVPFRAPKSAKTYQKIWTEAGSPLMVYSQKVKELLQHQLGDAYMVSLAMRYQNPSIEKALAELQKAQVSSIKVIALFPQYASATTGSVHQKVMEIVGKWQTIPPINFVNSFYNHPKIIQAFVENGQKFNMEQYDHVLFSFHGLPQRQLEKADISKGHCQKQEKCCESICSENQFCYGAQCYNTAQHIAQKLQIPKGKYTISFQSRLGKAEWLKPYTSDVISYLAESNHKKVLVFCPAFVADCLETIYEIGQEYQEEFIVQGGKSLDLVPSLNDNPLWIEALCDIVTK